MINLLHVNQDMSAERGGIGRRLHDFAPHLYALGVRPLAVTAQREQGLSGEYWKHYYLPEVSDPRATPMRWQPQLDQIIRREEVHLAHIHEVKNTSIVEHLSRSIPTIVHLHNYRLWCPGNDRFHATTDAICDSSPGWKCLVNAYRKRCATRHPAKLVQSLADVYRKLALCRTGSVRFLAGSEYMRRQAEQAGIPEHKIDVVHNAIDAARFDSQCERPIPDVTPGYVLFVGRLAHSKGLSYLLDAFSRVTPDTAKLLIVGDGAERLRVEERIQQLGIEGRVRLLGSRAGEELSWLYMNCQMVVFPSVWAEVFGNVGLEAMAAAKPVVAFDVGGISQWLQHDVTGYLVPPKDVTGLADRIQSLISDPVLAARFGAAGRREFCLRFSAERQAERLFAVYRSMLTTNDY